MFSRWTSCKENEEEAAEVKCCVQTEWRGPSLVVNETEARSFHHAWKGWCRWQLLLEETTVGWQIIGRRGVGVTEECAQSACLCWRICCFVAEVIEGINIYGIKTIIGMWWLLPSLVQWHCRNGFAFLWLLVGYIFNNSMYTPLPRSTCEIICHLQRQIVATLVGYLAVQAAAFQLQGICVHVGN